MPSVTIADSTAPANSKLKFRTVLGLGNQSGDIPATRSTFGRRSVDAGRSLSQGRKTRDERASASDLFDFEQDSVLLEQPDLNMEQARTATNGSSRPPVRMDAQDGPWSVSVAETPHDARSFCLYIKTPTHNITLTRTAVELVELDQKLHDSEPTLKLPILPIDESAVRELERAFRDKELPTKGVKPGGKRKSTFLNTLSRLASPAHRSASTNKSSLDRTVSGKTIRSSSTSMPTALNANGAATTVVSPAPVETLDPFEEGTEDGSGTTSPVQPSTPNSVVVTSLASYLTTISNTPGVRQARVWKRFVRVRTDDLESVRVERAIKRVRSDLGAHLESPKEKEKEKATFVAPTPPSKVAELKEEHKKDASIEEGDEAAELDTVSELPSATPPASSPPLPPAAGGEVSPTTESRIHRSQSADPDKLSTRLSRAYTTESIPKSRLSESTSFTQSDTAYDGASQTGDETSQTGDESSVAGSGRRRKKVRTTPREPKGKSQRKVTVDDFEMLRVLGKGCAGKVLLVRYKSTKDLYALKAITKRHVLAHQELQHTLTEQAVLKRMAAESKDPFVVKLWWSFHDKENLFLVMDFHPGGDLATQLARWGRLGRDRARFYAAEIVEGVEGLHAAGVIYRDLKPENILIAGDGHIVLTDFGLSKEFPRRTTSATAPTTPSGVRGGGSVTAGGDFYSSVPGTPSPQPTIPPWMVGDKGSELSGWPGQPVGHSDTTTTFCGTAEYLAPEVIQGLAYSYEVDWWSFGTMLYEMLTGITPFWANNHSDMYVRVLQDELQFPDDRAIDQDTKSLIRGLLQRNPDLRMCEPRIKKHPYFSMIDWTHVYYKRYIPPYVPPIDPSNASDTQNFDETFLDMEPVIDDGVENEQEDTDQEPDAERTDGEECNTTPSQSRSSSMRPGTRNGTVDDDSVDVFDGYSFKGRHSVVMDDEDEESEESEEGDVESILEPVSPSPASQTPEPEAVEDLEPKTPEARPTLTLSVKEMDPASIPVPDSPTTPVERHVKLEPDVTAAVVEVPEPRVPSPPPPPPPKPPVDESPKHAPPRPTTTTTRTNRGRREKSGVPALDRHRSKAEDEDADVTEKEDEEDDDWDMVEAADGEDRNGTKGNSLFARGVVDRYRLAVFGKGGNSNSRAHPRTVSGMSKDSELADSPSPSEKQRRGRTSGLTFRKNPRQFLRPKSPPATFSSAKSSTTSRSVAHSTSATSAASGSGLLTPSHSTNGSSASGLLHSLKSKESAVSVGTPSFSSDTSANGTEHDPAAASRALVAHPEEPEKVKHKKLKKYKEGAEKVLSMFASPRQQQQQQ